MNGEPTDADANSCGGDVAAYALGALEPHEAEAFEAHLASCAICRDELAAFQQVVDVLPTAVPAYRAPKRVRRNLMAAVAAEPKGSRRPAPQRRAWALPWGGLSPRLGLALGALAAVVVVAAGALTLGGQSTPTRVISAQVMGSGGTAEVRLTGGRAELVVHNMAAPPAGHIYEVWLKHGRHGLTPTSALFSVTNHGAGDVDVPGSLRGVSEVLVTPEPAGGSRVPTHAPVIRAVLT
jgi:anti-sigma-K factor RskA